MSGEYVDSYPRLVHMPIIHLQWDETLFTHKSTAPTINDYFLTLFLKDHGDYPQPPASH